MLCEQPDGGKLATAAKDKKDDHILLQIQDRDCVAIEVRYHRSCLRNYTVYQSRKPIEPIKEKYGKAFATFCSNVIDKKIIKDKQIYRMSSLRRLFVKAVRDIESQDASSYKTFSLKQRIKRKYPQLCFLQPRKRYTSEIVYVEALSTEDLVPGAVGSGEETDTTTTTDTDTFSNTDTDTTDVDERVEPLKKRQKGSNGRSKPLMPIASLRDRYATAQDLKDDIMQTRTNLPWPPTSSELTLESARTIVSSKLYNFLAWVVGASDDPEEEEKVKIGAAEDRRILTICQDIIYLATKGRQMMPKHTSLSMAMRHLSGSSELVGLLNGFGYCVSQTSVLEHDTALALQEIEKGSSKLPSTLEKSSYTTLVWDNNDFGERTLSGKGTTHNTNGIAVQHDNVAAVIPQALPVQSRKKTRQRSLPAPATTLVRFTGQRKSSPEAFADSVPLEMSQYNDVLRSNKEKDAAFYVAKSSQERLLPSWTGFNQLLSSNIRPKATIAYLPVIDASPTDFNTVHTVLHRSLEIAHQLELPAIVIVVDQAIYCKAQTIRWQEPTFQKKIVIRLGAFHTTMTALACIGKRFQEAGLQDILIEAGVVATGSVTGVMNGHNYNRSIRCHKLMAEALHRLRRQSFMCTLEEVRQHQYREVVSSLQGSFPSEFTNHIQGEMYQAMVKEYENFIEEGKKDATFNFWSSYLDMVENVLLFIRATREGDWQLHLASVRALLPWMFAYDRTNYARYLPVYWMEMSQLPTTHPYIYEELMKGHFGVQRQDSHGFAQVACDMSIEQTVNRDTKTRGGVKGFSNNQGAINRRVSGHHERALITRQCEEMAGKGKKSSKREDLTKSRMTRDQQDIANIMSTVNSMTNPFVVDRETDADDLVHLSSGIVAPVSVCSDLLKAGEKGDEAFINFAKTRLQGDTDLNKTITKMKLKTFANSDKPKVNMKGKEVVLKSARELLARLIIIGRVRKVDQRKMLSHSLSPCPPAICKQDGCLVKNNKAALLHQLENLPESSPTLDPPQESVWIIDGMALLQCLIPSKMPATMGQLAKKILKDAVYLARSTKSDVVHFVTDTYPSVSIKGAERKRRAASGSQRIKIANQDQPVPKQWKKLLANSFNKQHFTKFLYETWCACGADEFNGVDVYLAHSEECHKLSCCRGTTVSEAIPELYTTQEEADTRMMLHAKYISNMGTKNIIIKSPDTDVFVIGIAVSTQLEGAKLYFHTGKQDKERTLDMNAIQCHLGDDISDATVGLHTFTGCDAVSALYGRGKTKPFSLMSKTPKFTKAFQELGKSFTLTDDLISTLEDFVCKLYGMNKISTVNEARYALFSMATRQEDIMPPNKDALMKHIQRANYQTAIWRRCLESQPDVPSPVGQGWKLVDGGLGIDWMDMQPAQQSILELTSCKCNKSKCKVPGADDQCCASMDLPCTDLCECKNCDNMVTLDEEPIIDEVAEEDEGDNSDDDENFEEEELF